MQSHPPHAVYPLPQYQQYYIRRNPESLPAEKLAKQFAISVSEVLELWRQEEQEVRRRDYLAENGYTSDFATYAAEIASLYAEEPTRKPRQRYQVGEDRVAWLVEEP